MHRSKNVGDAFGRQRRLTRSQWDAVRRIELFLKAWTTVSPIIPGLMGRTAGKVEGLEATLSELMKSAESLAETGANYFPRPQQSDKLGKPVNLSPSTGQKLQTPGFNTFKQVDASRLSFVGSPAFDPSPYLDPLSKLIYADPLSNRLDPSSCSIRPPKLRIHCSRREKVKLFSLLDASGRLRVHLPHE